MKLHLRDIEPGMVDAWRAVFRGHPEVTITQGDIFNSDVPPADAIVSPANSFGFMDGGIDWVYSAYLGWDVELRLRNYLRVGYGGILPVGQALVVKTNGPETALLAEADRLHPDMKAERSERFPYVISAPTMTVPMSIVGTVNAFLAMRAALMAVKEHNARMARHELDLDEHRYIESILCPGLGTAVGQMPYEHAAAQMFEAYKAVVLKSPPHFTDLSDAFNYHDRLRRGLT